MDDIVDKALSLTSPAPKTPAPSFNIAPQGTQPPTNGKVGVFQTHEQTPTMRSLKDAFDSAIANHLSLNREERIQNAMAADRRLAQHIPHSSGKGAKSLLTKNAKLMKSETGYGDEEPVKLPDGRGVETTGLALAPAYQEGNFNTCPNSASCKDSCLGKTSGKFFQVGGGKDLSVFKGPRLNSLQKTIAMMREPEAFAVRLYDEIDRAKEQAARNGNHLGIRLNTLSDINPLVHKSLIEAHPDVSFYDYTKNNSNPVAPNHHYTYSSTGVSDPEQGVVNDHTNWKQMRRRLDGGSNVAMAFSHKEHLPEVVIDEETGKRYTVADGDKHDFRPLESIQGQNGVIVGLRNKKGIGSVDAATRDSKGFFVRYDPKSLKNPDGTYVRGNSRGLNKNGLPLKGPTRPTNFEVRIAPQGKQLALKDNEGKS